MQDQYERLAEAKEAQARIVKERLEEEEEEGKAGVGGGAYTLRAVQAWMVGSESGSGSGSEAVKYAQRMIDAQEKRIETLKIYYAEQNHLLKAYDEENEHSETTRSQPNHKA